MPPVIFSQITVRNLILYGYFAVFLRECGVIINAFGDMLLSCKETQQRHYQCYRWQMPTHNLWDEASCQFTSVCYSSSIHSSGGNMIWLQKQVVMLIRIHKTSRPPPLPLGLYDVNAERPDEIGSRVHHFKLHWLERGHLIHRRHSVGILRQDIRVSLLF